jgi:hypothetical protein
VVEVEMVVECAEQENRHGNVHDYLSRENHFLENASDSGKKQAGSYHVHLTNETVSKSSEKSI